MATMWIHESHSECGLCGRHRVFPVPYSADLRSLWVDAHMTVDHPGVDRSGWFVWETKRTVRTGVSWYSVPPAMGRTGSQKQPTQPTTHP